MFYWIRYVLDKQQIDDEGAGPVFAALRFHNALDAAHDSDPIKDIYPIRKV